MKTLIPLCLIVAAVAASQRTEAAPYTNYLDNASNVIAQAYDASEGKVQARLGKALAALEKPSSSVAGDYKMFTQLNTQLQPLSATEGLEDVITALDAAFDAFVLEATAEVETLSTRLQAATPQGLTRAASNQLAQASQAIDKAVEGTNVTKNISALRLAFVKIGLAGKSITKAEARPGFALNSVVGISLFHMQGGESGTLEFLDETNYTEGDEAGTYSYTRTGLNTATLVLNEPEDDGVTTVHLKFASATKGTFTWKFESSTDREGGTGKFTITSE